MSPRQRGGSSSSDGPDTPPSSPLFSRAAGALRGDRNGKRRPRQLTGRLRSTRLPSSFLLPVDAARATIPQPSPLPLQLNSHRAGSAPSRLHSLSSNRRSSARACLGGCIADGGTAGATTVADALALCFPAAPSPLARHVRCSKAQNPVAIWTGALCIPAPLQLSRMLLNPCGPRAHGLHDNWRPHPPSTGGSASSTVPSLFLPSFTHPFPSIRCQSASTEAGRPWGTPINGSALGLSPSSQACVIAAHRPPVRMQGPRALSPDTGTPLLRWRNTR